MLSDGAQRMLVFRVGDERFALPLGAVNEVIDMPAVQALPDSSGQVLGVATLRGELVAVFDPRPLLHAGTADTHEMALLFAVGDRRAALAIDDVFDPIVIEVEDVRPAPGMDASDGLLLGVVRQGTELIGVLDGDALARALRVGDEGEKR
jgi:purine-binding chemotaxis protein CheW